MNDQTTDAEEKAQDSETILTIKVYDLRQIFEEVKGKPYGRAEFERDKTERLIALCEALKSAPEGLKERFFFMLQNAVTCSYAPENEHLYIRHMNLVTSPTMENFAQAAGLKPVSAYPELQPWTCDKCKTEQRADARRYGGIYCHECATDLMFTHFRLHGMPEISVLARPDGIEAVEKE
jgi:hypothetical protein